MNKDIEKLPKMTKKEFTVIFKQMIEDVEEGYYDLDTAIDQVWDLIKYARKGDV